MILVRHLTERNSTGHLMSLWRCGHCGVYKKMRRDQGGKQEFCNQKCWHKNPALRSELVEITLDIATSERCKIISEQTEVEQSDLIAWLINRAYESQSWWLIKEAGLKKE